MLTTIIILATWVVLNGLTWWLVPPKTEAEEAGYAVSVFLSSVVLVVAIAVKAVMVVNQ